MFCRRAATYAGGFWVTQGIALMSHPAEYLLKLTGVPDLPTAELGEWHANPSKAKRAIALWTKVAKAENNKRATKGRRPSFGSHTVDAALLTVSFSPVKPPVASPPDATLDVPHMTAWKESAEKAEKIATASLADGAIALHDVTLLQKFVDTHTDKKEEARRELGDAGRQSRRPRQFHTRSRSRYMLPLQRVEHCSL